VIRTAGSSLYGAIVRWRRQWYAGDPERQRHLERPVVSVGNLCAGGSGKTPVVERVARLLLTRGERPAILTRGYARRRALDGVTVVSDESRMLAGLDEAGDEPLMLARALPGVPVLIAADRYLAGRLAESQLGTTVHLLDDGFQHLALARDVDLLLATEDDLLDRLLPLGRLREPLSAAAAADALLTTADGEAAGRLQRVLGVERMFHFHRVLGPAKWVDGDGSPVPKDTPVVAMAGVARPARFFADLAAEGWPVARTLAFRDHHRFTDSDLAAIAQAARAAGTGLVVTTEKDAVRLEGCRLDQLRLAAVPLCVEIAPEADFADWLVARVQDAPQPSVTARRRGAGPESRGSGTEPPSPDTGSP
jgi:tetraacyldisaccharide 4'-kinase